MVEEPLSQLRRIMSEPTMQEIQKHQGTRLSEKAPWETYSSEMSEKLDSQLEKDIQSYAQNRHESTSHQNEEELARLREYNNEAAKEYQWLHPDEYSDAGPRIGRILHSSEIINILRNDCGVKCWYSPHPQPRKVTVLIQRKGHGLLPPEVGCWSMLGFMPEYSLVNFDEHGVPLAERLRGWRTVLLQLIIKGALTEETANAVFGKARGPASERYLRTLYGFRNTYKD